MHFALEERKVILVNSDVTVMAAGGFCSSFSENDEISLIHDRFYFTLFYFKIIYDIFSSLKILLGHSRPLSLVAL